MCTTHRRQHRRSTGATLAFTLVVASFAFGVLGGTLGLLRELSLGAEPALLIPPLTIAAPLCGLVGVAFFLPVGILLLAS